MPSYLSRKIHQAAVVGAAALLASSVGCGNQKRSPGQAPAAASRALQAPITVAANTPIALTAQRMTTTLRDGTPAPMWGYCASASCPTPVTGAWSPGPTIVATAGSSLSIVLTNNLPVPTSLVVLGQLGGGLGTPTKMNGPAHNGQNVTTFPNNSSTASPKFVPPPQGQRVSSFGTEVAANGSQTLTWDNLKPGTYIYETGTLPSLQVPMGLYGVLVVTTAPTATTPGTAYPGVSYDADTALLFSEMDVVQNRAVDAAAVAGTDVNVRNDPSCSIQTPSSCVAAYPAAVNYAPTYFFINGQSFDRTAPQNSAFLVGDSATYASGNVLVRLLNAGSRTHVPSIVGLPMSLVAEDGNPAPGNPKVLSEVLLTAGKTYDAVVKPAANGTSYAAATYPVFDRTLSLSTDNHPDGGMQGFLLVDHAAAATDPSSGTCAGSASTTCTPGTTCSGGAACVANPLAGSPGNLPAAVIPKANPDTFAVSFNTSASGDVTANDVAVSSVALVSGPGGGTLVLNPGGTFTYTPNATFSGTDTFTYSGNGGAAGSAIVTLNVGAKGAAPIANADSYVSNVAGAFSAPRPGVLANDTDPSGYVLTASPASGSTCTTATLNPDGSFSVTASGASCQFSYTAINSQGTASPAATVTVTFGTPSKLSVAVVDAGSLAPIADYRWTLQEDLTFKHDTSATPALSARTVGTSFHRSHMPIVATGCSGAVSCGDGQQVRGAPVTAKVATTPDQVALDPAKNYYLSILPGDGGPPGHAMGGAEVKLVNGTWAPVTIKLQATPLVPAQMSVYIYEDNQPTNGQDEPEESPLGGFNIILFDPAGRTGDPAGQQSYDAFNMPLSNALLGTPGCPDEQNKSTNGTASTTAGNLVGAVYTCPNAPDGYTGDPAVYALAGHALIKNLTPARYDVIAHPGAARQGAGEVWWQTETLEGTPAQDAFVGVKEPVYFQEFGPPGPHTTIGFVNPAHVKTFASSNGLTGNATLKGKITNQHMSRPSAVTLWDSTSYELLNSTTCLVALNSQGGTGPTIATAQCDPDGNFTLSGIPAGSYEVAIFDQWLDQIIQTYAVNVPSASTPTTITVGNPAGNIPVLSWFTQYDQNIFMDTNGNGVYDPGEPGISNVPLTVRYRNGAPSNTTLSDSNGNGILVELFPLFNWYVAEADTTRFKQTGVTVVVDGGGKTDTAQKSICGVGKSTACPDGTNLWTSTYATGEPSMHTEVPGQLTYGVQGFISQRNRIDWGRTPYAKGENGGIVGTVVYSSTRPFDDMRFNVQTIWEPLVPRVTVNLYRKTTLPDGTQTLTLVDTTQTSSWDDYVNLVYGADSAQYVLGSDGVLRDPATGNPAGAGAYPAGRQVNLQCPGQLPGPTTPAPWDLTQVDPFTNFTLGNDRFRCFDGWHNWNQVQAAPYDGRYVFPSPAYVAAHPGDVPVGGTLVSLPPGTYVVEAVTPPGYEVVKEEDKNILIGDAFVAPATQQFGPLASIFILPDQATIGNANPYDPVTADGTQSDPTTNLGVYNLSTGTVFPECVGSLHRVPDYLSLYPQAQQVAPFAGMDRPLCDRKQIVLADQMQSSANFFVFTEVPAASNDTGIILDDATSEFNAYAPDFGEKATVPFVPVSIKDFTGNEIGRTYSDQWGAYNMMTPSSWLVNPPTPSGYGPNMLITCMNDPGPIPDPAHPGQLITDPQYNPAYSNFCYTNPFMPGQTTYLDTPVLPIAAFAAGYNPVDCSLPDATPAILRVDSNAGFGPWVPSTGGTLTITAPGDQPVPNPAYSGPFATGGLASQRTITRHYGFGASQGTGTVKIGSVALTNVTWGDTTITGTVPPNTPSGELTITTAAGRTSVDTVTVNVGGGTPTRVTATAKIQDAIDAAKPGDLILVDAGTYNELVIMWKPVRLQGVGAASVIINAAKYPNAKLEAWRPMINGLFAVDPVTGNSTGTAQVDPLPTQEITGGVVLLEPTVLGTEEGAGITVLAKNLPATQCANGAPSNYSLNGTNPLTTDSNFLCAPSRIDGVSVTGGDAGGGIYVNGWAHNLEISNNRVYGNAGAFNGGIRVGIPYLELESLPATVKNQIPGFGYDKNVKIHHNAVTKNGTVEGPSGNGGAGGGISICTGTDGYSVDHNYVCGNYSSSDGGGIGHLGFSQDGAIANNQILFNQSFQQTGTTHGGGIAVIGEPPVAGTVSLGTGNLTIDSNLIRGNFAEGGSGGGIRLQQVNGADVSATVNPAGNPVPARWNQVTVTNNMIVDNVAGWSGGGISLIDTLRATIVNNTVASNDSTGIAGAVLIGGVGRPAPSGIASETTTTALHNLLLTLSPGQVVANAISNPSLVNNVVWQNRSFYYSGDGRLCAGNQNTTAGVSGTCTVLADQSATGQCPSGARYWDIGVLGDASPAPGPAQLNPTYSVLTSTTGYGGVGNSSANPNLAQQYCNGSRVVPELGTVLNPPSVLNLQVAATSDEGNNYVNLRYGPLYVEIPSSSPNVASPNTFGDYHLGGPTGSAYNKGTTTPVTTHDFDGQTRPRAGAYDIGADEY